MIAPSVCGTAVAGVLLLVAPASAEFGGPITLSRTSTHASGPAPVVKPDGAAFVAWRRDGPDSTTSIEGRSVSPSGETGAILKLSKPGSSLPPVVGVNEAGDALVAWTGNGVQARVHPADGELGPLERIVPESEGAGSASVATSSDGFSLFVWQRASDGKLRGRYRFPGGALGDVLTIANNGPVSAFANVAIAPPGHAVVVWNAFEVDRQRVFAVPVTVGGGPGPIMTLSNTTLTAIQPRVAMAPDQTSVVVWLDSQGVKLRTGTPFGFAPEVLVAPPPAVVPQVAINEGGKVAVVWQGSAPGGENTTNLRIGSAPATTVGELRSSAPKVAIDDRGRVAVLYTQFDGASTRIAARVTNARGKFTENPQLLSARGQNAAQHALAMSGDGAAIATWQRRANNGILRAEAAVGP